MHIKRAILSLALLFFSNTAFAGYVVYEHPNKEVAGKKSKITYVALHKGKFSFFHLGYLWHLNIHTAGGYLTKNWYSDQEHAQNDQTALLSGVSSIDVSQCGQQKKLSAQESKNYGLSTTKDWAQIEYNFCSNLDLTPLLDTSKIKKDIRYATVNYLRDKSIAEYVPIPSGFTCFTGETLVDTPSGQKRIDSITAGDEVYGFDLKSNKRVTEKVSQILVHEPQTFWTVRFSNGTTLHVTPEHRFYVKNKNAFIALKDIDTNTATFQLDQNGSTDLSAQIEAIDKKSSTTETVYNLTTPNTHTYFVDGILVHNAK